MTSSPSQRGLFDSCPATRESIALVGSCPLCYEGPDGHALEAEVAGTVPDDAAFDEWMLNLARSS